ncbi:CRISPR-associated endonuclease Cas2 [Francisella philomiragia]|uniref:CRISPR-associated endoribonuclease Cas2 n=1 Tax=Francisella philomiragia TaxID=28110 RepID=A0AAW3DCJ0_9GAMM|nr:CRISPR-associated endonuclease Cas2 [Francisella philomiragia]KFJ43510.1 CRISPR-associated endoribonuclease Cas2 [Francisella philomiragia]MBK2254358.1 CRISPR-associated endonuclease Cas2 [Francisella philomiragia]MBK2272849.1 CRISPR-associated endonuclease Cas2 [Francisella philomiragia]MBK2276512.1 CRISPR-associated endonuclease Cas2 [Francisella philomiragia]MBK2280633.1 CRISPR-associated endonuclease Cas2 [Francisella philomiragia]
MQLRKEYLIAYDIEDNKARTIIYKQLLAYGLKAVQKSVFWGYMSIAELNAVKRMFDNALNTFDKVFITRVNMQEQKLDYSFGYDEKTFKDWDEYGHI